MIELRTHCPAQLLGHGVCVLPLQHTGQHQSSAGTTWPQACSATSPAVLGGGQLTCDLPNDHQLPHHDPAGATWGPLGGKHAGTPRCEKPIHSRYPELGDLPWHCTRQLGHAGPHAGYAATPTKRKHAADQRPSVLIMDAPARRRPWARRAKQDSIGQLIPEATWQAAIDNPNAQLPPTNEHACCASGEPHPEPTRGEGRSNLQTSNDHDPPPENFSGRTCAFRLGSGQLLGLAVVAGGFWVAALVTAGALLLSGASSSDAIAIGVVVAAILCVVTGPLWIRDPEGYGRVSGDGS